MSRLFLICLATFLVVGTTTFAQETSTGSVDQDKEGKKAQALFDKIAKDKKHVVIAELPIYFRTPLESFAAAEGITNGQLTRKQFRKFATQSFQKREAKPRSSKLFARMTTKEFNTYVNGATDRYFIGRDKNKDGFLDQTEISDRLKSQLKQFDKNGDGNITREEAMVYIRGYYVHRWGEPIPDNKKSSPSKSK